MPDAQGASVLNSNMKILAFDLGTTTGWAFLADGKVSSGSHSCAIKKNQHPGNRWMAFRRLLCDITAQNDPQAIYFEDVKNHKGVLASHLYGGFKAHLEHFASVRNIPIYGVGVGTVKKHWTGKGNASKQEMIDEAKKRGFDPIDDNQADALAILALAVVCELKRI